MNSISDLIMKKGMTNLQNEILNTHLQNQTVQNLALKNPTIVTSLTQRRLIALKK